MQVRGLHVFITGGSSGIGLALARQSAVAGAKVSIVARDPAKLERARTSILEAGENAGQVFTSAVDVSGEAALKVVIQDAERFHGPIDVLIACAGVSMPGYFEEIPIEVFERTMAVNYFGTLYAIKAVVPGMRQRGRGAVVLISSGAGLVGLFGYTPYSPSKFALRGLAESLRAELAPSGVRVMIVYPPDTKTNQLEEESRTKPPETKAITATGGLWSADSVARATLKGLERGRFEVTPGFQMTALARLHSVLGPVLFWAFDRIAASARRKEHENASGR
jgi:3-dehydrosphinganine reductase